MNAQEAENLKLALAALFLSAAMTRQELRQQDFSAATRIAFSQARVFLSIAEEEVGK